MCTVVCTGVYNHLQSGTDVCTVVCIGVFTGEYSCDQMCTVRYRCVYRLSQMSTSELKLS